MPSNLVRRVRAEQARLSELIPNIDQLSKQIEDIQSAHKIADSLPIDLQTLSEAREKITKSSIEAGLTEERINKAWLTSEDYLKQIKGSNEEAQKLIELCGAAYQITTTKGLAGAFDQRAGKLEWSMRSWVLGLMFALVIGSYMGGQRLELLSSALQIPNPNLGGLAIQVILSLLSVGAPLWFAWLATKQIGQRFRLAEDYAFKASVAKAYEGYRKEAARIDPEFEHRLFGSALTRLDEAPLRLVETNTHGSPWHELANSEAVRRTFDLFREAIATTAKALGRSESKPKPPETNTP